MLGMSDAFRFVADRIFPEYSYENEDPKTLWHYCQPNALIGIITQQVLWATDALYLNDASEVSYGIELFDKAIDQWTGKSIDPELINVIKNKNFYLRDFYSYYVSCFTERGDDLSQWRAYSNTQGGFAVGFNRADLHNAKEGGETKRHYISRRRLPDNDEQTVYGDKYQIVKVIYDENLQIRMVRSLLDDMQNEAQYYPSNKRYEFYSVCFNYIPYMLLSFKDKAFNSEQEWRIICIMHKDMHRTLDPATGLWRIKFRAGQISIIPYFEAKIYRRVGVGSGTLPIVAITVGPSSHQELVKKTVYHMLLQQEYRAVQINSSNISVRF